jgi:tetratricopeptide (TPR) repeat protein
MILNYERYQLRTQKKKKKLFFILLVFIFILGFGIGLFFLFQTPETSSPSKNNMNSNQNLTALWENREYYLIISICDYKLENRPLDQYYLIYRGFSYFHKAKDVYDAASDLFQEYFNLNYKEIDLNNYLPIAEKKKNKLSGLIQELQTVYTDNQLQNYSCFQEFSKVSTNIEKLNMFITGCISLLDQSIISLRRALLKENIGIEHQIFYILGKAYFFKGSNFSSLSIKYLELAVESGSKEYDLYEYLATAYELTNQTEKAVYFLEQVYKQKPLDIYLYYLAKYNWKLSNLDSAGEYLNKIINKTKDKELLFECKLLLGNIYFDKKEYSKAKELYETLLEESDNSAEAHFRLALIYEQLGDYVKYRSELRKAYSLNPNIEDVRSRLYN